MHSFVFCAMLFISTIYCQPVLADIFIKSIQIVGTIHNSRGQWNPFNQSNDMDFDKDQNIFVSKVNLASTGGFNGDGIYAIRFHANNDVNSVFKFTGSPQLVDGRNADFANNIIIKIINNGKYTIKFSPYTKTFDISPAVNILTKITSMQLNGFVYDEQNGENETTDNKRTYPIEKWNETLNSHNMENNNDGTWSKKVFLKRNGGLNHDGVYQILFSANHIVDWGFSALNDKPWKLCGGSGYISKQGRVIDSPIVFHVTRDDYYIIKIHPTEYWYHISPDVKSLNSLDEIQLNGYVMPEPWNHKNPNHKMTKIQPSLWEKEVFLSSSGGPGKDGVYSLNFSLNNDWHLDSIAMGGIWGKTWHSLTQENNIVFKVMRSAIYTIRLETQQDVFSIHPEVLPISKIYSFQLVGNFDEFINDGNNGWNPYDPIHQMDSNDCFIFTKVLELQPGKNYEYKYAANGVGWQWAFADYIHDGYRKIASHGNPPSLTFSPKQKGKHKFTANIISGEYSVRFDP